MLLGFFAGSTGPASGVSGGYTVKLLNTCHPVKEICGWTMQAPQSPQHTKKNVHIMSTLHPSTHILSTLHESVDQIETSKRQAK